MLLKGRQPMSEPVPRQLVGGQPPSHGQGSEQRGVRGFHDIRAHWGLIRDLAPYLPSLGQRTNLEAMKGVMSSSRGKDT